MAGWGWQLVGLCGLVAACGTETGRAAAPWTLVQGRYGAAAVCDGQAIYVVGGGGVPGGVSGDVERIDLATGLAETTALRITPRRFITGVLLGREIFIFGGEAKEGFIASVEAIDLDKQTVRKAAFMRTPRRIPSAVVVGAQIYTLGGLESGYAYNEPRSQAVEIFTPARNRWTEGPPMLEAKEAAAVLSGGQIYLLGGYNQGKRALASCQRLDLASGAWEELAPAPYPLSAYAAVDLGDTIVCFGDYEKLGRVAAYTPATGRWTLLSLRYTPRRHAAACIADGWVYVVGGNTSTTSPGLAVIERYSVEELKAAAGTGR